MKDKVLETVVAQSVEHIARALRNYSGEPIGCHVYVETRMNSHDGADAYSFRVFHKKGREIIVTKAGEVHYIIGDDGSEMIRRTEDGDDFQI